MISLIYTMLCKLYTWCVNFNTYCVNSRCFVANFPIFWFTRFCVKFWPQKLRSSKSFDKYHVWAYHQMNWQSESKKAWAFRSDEMVQRNMVVTQSTTVSGLCWRLPARVPRPMLWSPPRVTATYNNNFLWHYAAFSQFYLFVVTSFITITKHHALNSLFSRIPDPEQG